MIKFEKNQHWYTKDGAPSHDSDLRDARKQLLYPSVSTIDKDVFKNDFLDKWKVGQILEAASNTFVQPHETQENYCQRVYQDSLQYANEAASFGKAIHQAIEDYPQLSLDTSLLPWIDKFGEWYDANVGSITHRERVLLDHDIGVAGRCDFIGLGQGVLEGKVILVDPKTQGVKIDPKTGKKKPVFYDSWPRQLAFYGVAFAKETGTFPDLPVCISLIIDSYEPCPPFVKIWTKEEILDNYIDFVTGAYLWFSKRDYFPIGRWKPVFPFRMP